MPSWQGKSSLAPLEAFFFSICNLFLSNFSGLDAEFWQYDTMVPMCTANNSSSFVQTLIILLELLCNYDIIDQKAIFLNFVSILNEERVHS